MPAFAKVIERVVALPYADLVVHAVSVELFHSKAYEYGAVPPVDVPFTVIAVFAATVSALIVEVFASAAAVTVTVNFFELIVPALSFTLDLTS